MTNAQYVAMAALGLSLIAGGAAQAATKDRDMVIWNVGTQTAEGGGFQKCLANGAGADGKTLVFVMGRDVGFVGMAIDPKWTFAARSAHTVTFDIDGASGGPLEATVVAENSLAYSLPNDRAVIEKLGTGHKFQLRVDGKAAVFSLQGAGGALQTLHQCWAAGLSSLKK